MSKPNIIFITTDTQGRNVISAYTNRPGIETPNIDKFAQESVLFENAFTTCPLCTPARGSWYSGMYPDNHGASCNSLSISRSVPLLGETLQQAGYQTKHLGKWHLGGDYNGNGKAQGGFDDEDWYELGNFYKDVGSDGPNRFGGWNKGWDDPEFCFGNRLANRAINIIEKQTNSERPIFLAIDFDEPHGPYICPPPFRDRFKDAEVYKPSTFGADLSNKPKLQQDMAASLAKTRSPTSDTFPQYYQRYYDCNSYVDSEIGRIIAAVKQHLPEDTVIIFTSDHGDHLGEFGLGPKGPTMYDSTIAVPLIIFAPGVTSKPRRETGLVSSVDVWTTIHELAGLPQPQNESYEGKSLIPVLKEEQEAIRNAVYLQYQRFGTPFDQCGGFYPIRCIRNQEWKLSINLFDTDELYCITEDPEEVNNRINDPTCASIRDELHDQLLDWQQRVQDSFRGPIWESRPWRNKTPHPTEALTPTGLKDSWDFEVFY